MVVTKDLNAEQNIKSLMESKGDAHVDLPESELKTLCELACHLKRTVLIHFVCRRQGEVFLLLGESDPGSMDFLQVRASDLGNGCALCGGRHLGRCGSLECPSRDRAIHII